MLLSAFEKYTTFLCFLDLERRYILANGGSFILEPFKYYSIHIKISVRRIRIRVVSVNLTGRVYTRRQSDG
jgi:hypothetical protein